MERNRTEPEAPAGPTPPMGVKLPAGSIPDRYPDWECKGEVTFAIHASIYEIMGAVALPSDPGSAPAMMHPVQIYASRQPERQPL